MNRAITTREAVAEDAAALAAILNAIIARGGTTAHQVPFEVDAFQAAYLGGERYLHCAVAAAQGVPVGFQFLGRHGALPPGWADIATFARPAPKLPGVGRALFALTRGRAAALGLIAINATIRADNAEGLGFYNAVGFRDYAVAKAVPLADGTRVDRISKRFDLGLRA